MSLATIITPAILDKIIGLLVPLFLTGAAGDLLTARHAASRLLADYQPETEEELRLAAEIICFGFGALDALSQSMAPNLTLNAILRLRGSANTQQRSANQCQRTLDKLRTQRRRVQADQITERPAPRIAEAEPVTLETVTLSDCEQIAQHTGPAVILSRQQRRAAERKAGKAQRKQAEADRREALRIMRATSAHATANASRSQPLDRPLAA